MSAEGEAGGDVWTIRRVVAWATDDLRKRGSASPRLDVELLLGQVLHMDRVKLLIDAERPLSKPELATYRALHQRRRAGEPVAYLLGVREFYGRTFRVDPRVLVLCTGSGCVAVTLARERPTTRVLATDLDEGALAVARENAIRLGAAHNLGFVRSDLFTVLTPGHDVFDLITANPPYIPDEEIGTLQLDVRAFEPRQALAGGPDGLDVLRRIVAEAPRFLPAGGVLAVEVGAGQAPDVKELFAAARFDAIETRRDYGGHERVVSGVRV
jgi:release factor glutamine methyltransferase